nr:hypothetical protein [Acinetobacter courvalinii]
MDLIKFIRSFNTIDTYLVLATTLLIGLSIYFYYIAPYE